MSNLKLAPDNPTPLEKLLLDASRAEQPSEEHKARLRALLGIGLPLSGPLAGPPPAAPQRAAANLAPAAGAASKSVAGGKVAFGLGVVALLGVFALTRHRAQAPAVVPAVKPAVAVQASPTPPAAPPVVEVAPAAEAVAAVAPRPSAVAPTAALRSARTDASADAAADLSEQIRLIEAARAGVAARDPKAASAALDAYSAKFPRGSFGQEAMVLRIRSVDMSGDAARATALARSFIARFPNSPHVARLKPIAERGASR